MHSSRDKVVKTKLFLMHGALHGQLHGPTFRCCKGALSRTPMLSPQKSGSKFSCPPPSRPVQNHHVLGQLMHKIRFEIQILAIIGAHSLHGTTLALRIYTFESDPLSNANKKG